MNNSEFVSGHIDLIQKKYGILSDLVPEYHGKVQGSQSHVSDNMVSLILYYEVPVGKSEALKQKFRNSIIVLQ